jgi:tetratricopeptide (TPR) repeat protein
MCSGNFEEAQREIEKARKLDPVSPLISMEKGWILYYARRYDEAIRQIRKTLEFDENFIIAYVALGLSYERKKMYPEAIAALANAQKIAGDLPLIMAAKGFILGKSGQKDAARTILEEFLGISAQKNRYVPSLYIALIYLGLGDTGQTLRWIEKAYEEGTSYLLYLKTDPKVDDLRPDPRFQQIIKKIGFKE